VGSGKTICPPTKIESYLGREGGVSFKNTFRNSKSCLPVYGKVTAVAS
jgi:hypothetical protein